MLPTPAGWSGALNLMEFSGTRSSVERELHRMLAESRVQIFKGAFHSNPEYVHRYGLAAMKDVLQTVKAEAADLRT